MSIHCLFKTPTGSNIISIDILSIETYAQHITVSIISESFSIIRFSHFPFVHCTWINLFANIIATITSLGLLVRVPIFLSLYRSSKRLQIIAFVEWEKKRVNVDALLNAVLKSRTKYKHQRLCS